ncbi:hypothetical protein [Salegentibacter maritimus]|uniref:DUF3240 domain-containing protein n=1 Tax=Salegentibacter maritimus TaxID=2794347 RepID=A0ABS0TIK8_9FLAO|nr:hypothetical protein [Salegentibacter maritimus]MBI6120086.1 hypothetical protein [Salegentibacter maritimus]
MKLLILTSVAEFQEEILKLFKTAKIEAFSRSEIDGYKKSNKLIATLSWFPGEKGGNESLMFFSFTEKEKIDLLFNLVSEFNEKMETNNPIRLAVVNIEKYI